MKLWSLGILMALAAHVAFAKEPISSVAVGVYAKDEKAQLAPAFIKAVEVYLRHYQPRLMKNEGDYVQMRAHYDLLFDIELKINAEDFEVKVTLVQETRSPGERQKQAAHLASGVFKRMENNLAHPSRRKG